MKVIDPRKAEPYVVLDEGREKEAEVAARRVSISRAFGLAGLQLVSEELATPSEMEKGFVRFYRPEERRRLRRPRKERIIEAVKEVGVQRRQVFQDRGMAYVGREVTMEIPGEDFLANTGFRSLTVRQGINAEVIEQARAIGEPDFVERVGDVATNFLQGDQRISIQSEDRAVVVRDGTLAIATAEFG